MSILLGYIICIYSLLCFPFSLNFLLPGYLIHQGQHLCPFGATLFTCSSKMHMQSVCLLHCSFKSAVLSADCMKGFSSFTNKFKMNQISSNTFCLWWIWPFVTSFIWYHCLNFHYQQEGAACFGMLVWNPYRK